eukprot:TCONS_00013619-protein
MMADPKISIELSNEKQEIFYPGEKISGHVVIELDKPLETKNVCLTFGGKGDVVWVETIADDIETYHGKEEIFMFEHIFYGQRKSSSRVVLPTGRTSYSFVFSVPNGIPSSYTGIKIGFIRYEMEAQITLAYKSNIKVKRTIHIHEVIDCNLPRYLSGIGMSCTEDVGFCCYKYGPIRMSALIPGRSCFCPGENIPIEMMIENNSSKLVTEARIKLIQTAIYREHHEHHKDGPITVRDYTIAKSKVLFKDSTYLRYIGEGLTAPENTSPTNWRLKIIKVRYHVEVRIDLSWTTNEPCIEIPIIIGTVPLGIKSKDINQNNWF